MNHPIILTLNHPVIAQCSMNVILNTPVPNDFNYRMDQLALVFWNACVRAFCVNSNCSRTVNVTHAGRLTSTTSSLKTM